MAPSLRSSGHHIDPRHLAHLLGSVALTLVSLVAVDMPGGFLGPAERLSEFGNWYAIGSGAVLAIVLVLGTQRDWPRALTLGLMACNIGVFVPALPADPVVGVMVVGWHAVLLGVEVLGLRLRAPPSLVGPNLPPSRRTPRDAAAAHLAVVGMILAALVVGYELTASRLAIILAALGTLGPATIWLVRMTRRRSTPWSIVVAAGLLAVAVLGEVSTLIAFAAISNAVIIGEDVARGDLFGELLHSFLSKPALLIVGTFAGLVAAGTLLLTLPSASATGVAIQPIDALFTATSATCVTGLIVLDTPTDFSAFGHGVILGLIQVGGLGIMVLSTFATLLLGERLGLRGERALSEVLDIHDPASAYRLVKVVIIATLAIEGTGAAVLTVLFHAHGMAWGAAAWLGVFHSISAFCNAGFALYSDSLIGFEANPLILLTHMVLIVSGGIGFIVIAMLWRRLVLREVRRLDLHSRVVLWTTGVLLVAGFVAFALLEWSGALAVSNAPPGTRLWNAAFQSVTLRTAGFNSIPFDQFGGATILVMIVFMFIGASPGSTGGGIKTTTFAVLAAAVRGILRGRPVAEMFGREIPQDIVYRSAAIFVVSGGFVGTGLFLLLLTQPLLTPEALAFEAFSAIATVGLSLGITAALDPFGKFVVIVLMFAGRVGPVTLALMLARRTRNAPALPRATIMVG